MPHIYCAPQGTTVSDDIQVGARSTYLTSGAGSPAVGVGKDRKNYTQFSGGGPPGSGGGGGNHSRPRDQSTGPSNISYQDKTSSFQTSPNTQKNPMHGAYYNYNQKVAPHNISNKLAPPSGNTKISNTSTLPLVRNTTRQSYTYGQLPRQSQNMNNSFARGSEYNSSRMSNNNRTNSSYNASMSQSSQGNDQDYMNMDNRSRHARFQNHKYENVHVRNGLRGQGHMRGQGHVRHSSEDRTYGQQRQSEVSHTRYHSLDRSGYGVYNREYRPLLQSGRHRHTSSHDQQALSKGNRQRSHSRDQNQSHNIQGQQVQGRQGQSQGQGGTSRKGQGHPMHVQQSINAQHRHLNNVNTSNIQGAGHRVVSANNHYKQNSIRSHSQNKTGQQELDSVGSWGDQDRSSTSDTPVLDTSEVSSFLKRPHGRYIVLFPFTGQVSSNPHLLFYFHQTTVTPVPAYGFGYNEYSAKMRRIILLYGILKSSAIICKCTNL